MGVTHFSGPIAQGAGSVEDVTGALTLDSRDNGKFLQLNAAAGAAITLPAVADSAGYRIRFTVKALFATTDWVISSAEGDNLEGSLVVAGAAVAVNAADSVTFELGADNIGDFVDMWSDGTLWYVTGVGQSASSITSTG